MRTQGFTLIELALVLAIVGFLATFLLSASSALRSAQLTKETRSRLVALDTALVGFVSSQGRLPCPADGSVPSGGVNAGVEQRNVGGVCTATAVTRGVVPWVSLGLSEADALDAWNNRITYRVTEGNNGVAHDRALDMTWCDPAGLANTDNSGGGIRRCDSGCTLATIATNCTSPLNYLNGRGIEIWDAVGVGSNILMDPGDANNPRGAAYVLISHGDNAAGAYSTAGVLQPGSGIAPGLGELRNANNQVLQSYYVDANFNESTTNQHFDDLVSRPSIMTVVTRAQLGPRAHN